MLEGISAKFGMKSPKGAWPNPGVSAYLRLNITEARENSGCFLSGAYREVFKGRRVVTLPMASRDPMTSSYSHLP